MKFGTSLAAIFILLAFAISPELPTWKVCGLARHFGVNCPACGTTRSVWHLMHGRFLESWNANPLGLLVCYVLVRIPFHHLAPGSMLVRVTNAAAHDKVLIWLVAGILTFRLLCFANLAG